MRRYKSTEFILTNRALIRHNLYHVDTKNHPFKLPFSKQRLFFKKKLKPGVTKLP
ncbi:hypothetical protein MuYL_3019 [Mucilaginibacter xinganensis]|uniref:Uncharacterized protein n=1 Tax=Mucilaginibacter xinganensis TaxID=1234841 RepID=A0A223NYX4_9SPHI|nr:hypothetical protein MuYL_3019 [Mucilaginibacter xinganensis]